MLFRLLLTYSVFPFISKSAEDQQMREYRESQRQLWKEYRENNPLPKGPLSRVIACAVPKPRFMTLADLPKHYPDHETQENENYNGNGVVLLQKVQGKEPKELEEPKYFEREAKYRHDTPVEAVVVQSFWAQDMWTDHEEELTSTTSMSKADFQRQSKMKYYNMHAGRRKRAFLRELKEARKS